MTLLRGEAHVCFLKLLERANTDVPGPAHCVYSLLGI